MMNAKPQPKAGISIFLISLTGLAYELALMRIFSIMQWHHFAYMVISVTMLGFGAAGTVLAIASELRNEQILPLLRRFSAAFALSLPLCYSIAQFIPFETFLLPTQPSQMLWLLLLYLVLVIPFFCWSGCISLGLIHARHNLHSLYGLSMLGAGSGALALTAALFYIHPRFLPAACSLLALPAYLLLKPGRTERKAISAFILVITATSTFIPLRVSQYKEISFLRQLGDLHEIEHLYSPLSVVTVIQSELIRETPGQLGNYPMSELGPLPDQVGLLFDGGGLSVVNRFDGNLAPFAYLDYVTAALPYHLNEKSEVALLGAGGGSDIMMALEHGAEHITAVEVDPSVFKLMNGTLNQFSGGLYTRPNVTAVHAEGRAYLQSNNQSFDLIQIALLDSFNTCAAGVYALSENYLYTREALQLYLNRLSPNGLLSITRWIKTPARDTIKLFATAIEALEKNGISDPEAHLLWIRSWNTATVIISQASLTTEQLTAARSFCRDRNFDLCYAPGMQSIEANQHIILPEPVYYEAAQALLSDQRKAFYRDFLFQIRPATDNSPFFFRFFKWHSLKRLISGMGNEWIPFVEWGYLTLLATFIQAVVAATLCIGGPLFLLRRRNQEMPHLLMIAYFGLIGMGYMMLEIAFIQRLMLYLAYPIYAVAVVLTAFLVFSGLGSMTLGRLPRIGPAVAGISLLALLSLLKVGFLNDQVMGTSDGIKIFACILTLAPLAFLMGIPYPVGLRTARLIEESLLPWAWGINGFSSVLAAPLAILLAIHTGFSTVILLALACYISAALIFRRLAQI